MNVGNHVLRKNMLLFLIYVDKMFFTFHRNENPNMLIKIFLQFPIWQPCLFVCKLRG